MGVSMWTGAPVPGTPEIDASPPVTGMSVGSVNEGFSMTGSLAVTTRPLEDARIRRGSIVWECGAWALSSSTMFLFLTRFQLTAV